MPKKRIIKSDDDTVLWQRVITEVKPLKSTVEFVEFARIFAQSDQLAPVSYTHLPSPRDGLLSRMPSSA